MESAWEVREERGKGAGYLSPLHSQDYGFECKVFLIDYNDVVKGEGVGITNSREGKYAKSNGYSVQNVVLKKAKKWALVDAVLNVGNLSTRFTQDVEDMNRKADNAVGKNPDNLKP